MKTKAKGPQAKHRAIRILEAAGYVCTRVMTSPKAEATLVRNARPSTKTEPALTAWEVSPLTCDIVEQAKQEHFRITPCEACGRGPRIHSKTRPHATCLRCGDFQVTTSILPCATKQKCRRCQAFHWRVLRSPYCERCQDKVVSRGAA